QNDAPLHPLRDYLRILYLSAQVCYGRITAEHPYADGYAYTKTGESALFHVHERVERIILPIGETNDGYSQECCQDYERKDGIDHIYLLKPQQIHYCEHEDDNYLHRQLHHRAHIYVHAYIVSS